MRCVVSPSTSSIFSPAVVKGRRALFVCFFTAGHLVNSGNRQAPRLCVRLPSRSIGKRDTLEISRQHSAVSVRRPPLACVILSGGSDAPRTNRSGRTPILEETTKFHCHHERSEGSAFLRHPAKSRFLAPNPGARNDNSCDIGVPRLLVALVARDDTVRATDGAPTTARISTSLCPPASSLVLMFAACSWTISSPKDTRKSTPPRLSRKTTLRCSSPTPA